MRICIIKGMVVSYSQGFYDRLLAQNELDVTIFCQSDIPGVNLKSIHTRYPEHINLVRNITLKHEKASWQFLPWRKIFSEYDVYFVTGNPRNLSNVAIATCLKFLGKKVVLWTMGHSHRANPLTENIRIWWSKYFNFLLLYTDAEVHYFREKGFKDQFLIGQNNGLDQQKIDREIEKWSEEKLDLWRKAHEISEKKIILSCSRLTEKNRYDVIIQALAILKPSIPDIYWVVIGDGPELSALKSLAHSLGVIDNVHFAGEIYEEELLCPWFLSSSVFAHPGAIGLSLMHAFGYGLPLVTHGNATLQGPEFAAFEEGVTGLSYKEGDFTDFAEKVALLLLDDEKRKAMAEQNQQITRTRYNVDIMVERFIRIAGEAYQS